jgi:hypothetical protein
VIIATLTKGELTSFIDIHPTYYLNKNIIITS